MLFVTLKLNQLTPSSGMLFVRQDEDGVLGAVDLVFRMPGLFRREFTVDFGRKKLRSRALYWLRVTYHTKLYRGKKGFEWACGVEPLTT